MTEHDDDRQIDPADHLLEAIKYNLSPHAVALIAAKLRPACAEGELGREAERQCQWLADRLVELLGTDEYIRTCEELGL